MSLRLVIRLSKTPSRSGKKTEVAAICLPSCLVIRISNLLLRATKIICDDIKITLEDRQKEFVLTFYFKPISFGNLRHTYFVPFTGISLYNAENEKKSSKLCWGFARIGTNLLALAITIGKIIAEFILCLQKSIKLAA